MTNIDALDNYIMLNVFKYLDYYDLANSSRVSKRFCNIIRANRKFLARLSVLHIEMIWCRHARDNDPAASIDTADVTIFNKKLSSEAYNEWTIRNQYSQQVSLEGNIGEKLETKDERNVYTLKVATSDYKSNGNALYAEVELNHENWPLFQHFVRLLTDPFVDIRWVQLAPQNDVLNLLEINLDRERLKCEWMIFSVDTDFFVDSDYFCKKTSENSQNLVSWIKNHVSCIKFRLLVYFDCHRDSIHDQMLLDFFLTGANCTSAIDTEAYDLSNLIVDFEQKFSCLKQCNENQLVQSITSAIAGPVLEVMKQNYAKFGLKPERNGDNDRTEYVFEFINNDIKKKLEITFIIFDADIDYDYYEDSNEYHGSHLLLKIKHL